jgi:hypothetical protein
MFIVIVYTYSDSSSKPIPSPKDETMMTITLLQNALAPYIQLIIAGRTWLRALVQAREPISDSTNFWLYRAQTTA